MTQLILSRLRAATFTAPDLEAWMWIIALLSIFALISLPVGFRLGFLRIEPLDSPVIAGLIFLGSFLMPGVTEELFFRVLLLPHPTENASAIAQWIWASISLFAFVVYHPLNFFAKHNTFKHPVFLLLATLLGIVCAIAYLKTGSLWLTAIAHWLPVAVWLTLLGGYRKVVAL